MARKKKVIDETPEPEIQAQAPEPEEVRVDHEVPPMSEFIMVRAIGSNQHEPFQRIAIPTGYGVPVKRSNWITAQLKAGLITFA